MIKDAIEIGKNAGLKYIYGGNIGIATILENTNCPGCDQYIIERRGFEYNQ